MNRARPDDSPEPEPETEVYAVTPGGWSIFDHSVQVLQLRNHAAAEGMGFDPAKLNIYMPVVEVAQS